MSTDKISNLLSSLKNASLAGKQYFETDYFRQGKEILGLLEARGLIKSVKVFKPEGSSYRNIRVDLLTTPQGLVRRIEAVRISKPGRRIYSGHKDIKSVKAGLGILVVSTPRGMLSGEEAKKRKLGGELVCKVYFD